MEQMDADLKKAKQMLVGKTLVACKGDCVFWSDKKGVAPMLTFIENGVDLRGFSVADVVVGKAAAMLFVKAGISRVYTKTLSELALETLNNYGVPVIYENLTKVIINREKTGMCPMEKTVFSVSDAEEAYQMIKAKYAELQRLSQNASK